MTERNDLRAALDGDDFRDEHERAMRDHILAREHVCDDLCSDDIVTRLVAALAVSAPDEGPTFWNQAEQRIEHARPAAPAALDVDALPEATYQETAYGSTVSRDAIRAALAASAPEEEPRYHIRATDSMHHEHRRLAASAPDEGPPCIKCGYPEYPSHHDPKMPQWEDHPFEADLRYPPRLAVSAPDEGPLLGFVNSDPNRPLDQEPRPATPAALDEETDFNDAVKVIAEHGYAPVRLDRLNTVLARPAVPAALCEAPANGGPCVLPRGHNMGRPDVPDNHWWQPGKPLHLAEDAPLAVPAALGVDADTIDYEAAGFTPGCGPYNHPPTCHCPFVYRPAAPAALDEGEP